MSQSCCCGLYYRVASNALQVLNSTIDMIIVGEFVGTPGLSAVSQIGITFGWSFTALFLGYGLAPYGCAVPGMIYFLSGAWKKRKILAEDI